MPMRRGMVLGMLGIVVLAGVFAAPFLARLSGLRADRPQPQATVDARSPISALAAKLREGNAEALAALHQRMFSEAQAKTAPKPLTAAEAREWVDCLVGLRTGYPRFSPYGRASAIAISGRIMALFAVDPTPDGEWARALPPSHDLLTAGLADAAMNVRVAALDEVSRLWSWLPGCMPSPTEEDELAKWKEAFHAPVVVRLADPQPALRASAVACLATLPIDSLAAPAAAYVADPDVDVRRQVLMSYAARRTLLTDEMILARLSDPDPRIAPLAEQILKGRGLDQEQIGLGGLIAHPKPELRESVIPLIAHRTDIDPVVWLVHLSRDKEESVRLKAVEALAGRDSAEARVRLAEMALSDPSPKVKKMAGKLVVPGEETASLPPLPGSPSLTPKAN